MTAGQQRAFDRGWQRWGLAYRAAPLDFDAAFGRAAHGRAADGRAGRRIVEIGFGMGQSLLAMAAADPSGNYLGIEVHRPGVGKLLHGMEQAGIDNIRIYCHDAVEVLRDCIVDDCLDRIQIFFPDPWHKKRHHKRRLIQPPFAALLRDKLRPGGILHLATDWAPYAEQMLDVLQATEGLRNVAGPGRYAERPAYRPETKFERRGQRLGHGVFDLLFERSA
jgi:tRNA (guanine-N7-)-methyltransferase